MEDNSDPESPVQAAQSTAFTNVTLASGMTYEAGFVIPPQNLSVRDIATSGAAAGDYDADGDIDVFIVRGDVAPIFCIATTATSRLRTSRNQPVGLH